MRKDNEQKSHKEGKINGKNIKAKGGGGNTNRKKE